MLSGLMHPQQKANATLICCTLIAALAIAANLCPLYPQTAYVVGLPATDANSLQVMVSNWMACVGTTFRSNCFSLDGNIAFAYSNGQTFAVQPQTINGIVQKAIGNDSNRFNAMRSFFVISLIFAGMAFLLSIAFCAQATKLPELVATFSNWIRNLLVCVWITGMVAMGIYISITYSRRNQWQWLYPDNSGFSAGMASWFIALATACFLHHQESNATKDAIKQSRFFLFGFFQFTCLICFIVSIVTPWQMFPGITMSTAGAPVFNYNSIYQLSLGLWNACNIINCAAYDDNTCTVQLLTDASNANPVTYSFFTNPLLPGMTTGIVMDSLFCGGWRYVRGAAILCALFAFFSLVASYAKCHYAAYSRKLDFAAFIFIHIQVAVCIAMLAVFSSLRNSWGDFANTTALGDSAELYVLTPAVGWFYAILGMACSGVSLFAIWFIIIFQEEAFDRHVFEMTHAKTTEVKIEKEVNYGGENNSKASMEPPAI